LALVVLAQLLLPQKALTVLILPFLPLLQLVAVVVARTTPIQISTMVLMAVRVVVRQVFSKPQQLVVRQAPLPLQFKALLAVVLPPLQVHRVQGLVRVAVVHRKLETLKTQTLAVLAVTVLLIVFLAHQLHTLVVAVVVVVATMLKQAALVVLAAAVLVAR
tara:strand:+ start:165 stop:647 length:483 start_codon:yes stop_codon:yes gene_type:complete